MALRFVDSFDHYSAAQMTRKWTTSAGAAISSGNGRHGSAALRFSDWAFGSEVSRTLDQQATWIIGFAFKVAALPPSQQVLVGVRDGSTRQVEVRVNADGTVAAYNGAGTLLGASAATLSAGVFQYLECKFTIHNSTGTVTVRKNGATILALTDKDTQNSGNASANRVALLGNAGTVGGTLDFDDLYVCDAQGSVNNDFLGDVRIDVTLPNGAGNAAQWTPSAGSNWQNVDENPATDDTDYNASATPNQIDTYTYPTIAPTAGTVYGVALQLTVRKDDAGARSIAGMVRQGGTDYAGAAEPVADNYLIYTDVREQDPDTSAAWTIAGVNSAEFGIKLVS